MRGLTLWFAPKVAGRSHPALVAAAVLSGVALHHAASAQERGPQPQVYEPVAPIILDTNMRALTPEAMPSWSPGDPVRTVEDLKEEMGPTPAVEGPEVLQTFDAVVMAPVAGVNFEGIGATGVLPPDTVGDVGPNHYIQMVNSAFSIYDKSANLLAGPVLINALWGNFGGPCETLNNGDPIVRYDELADRWLISQFALPGGNQGFFECVAISRTPDPVSGGWFLYAFPTTDGASGAPVFPDYPKIAVWPDAYYMGTQRGFPNGGLDVWALERDQMLVGAPAALVQFSVPAPSLFLMPSDLDGPPPSAGTPNFFVRQVDGERFGGSDRLEVFAFDVDWSNPAGSTFSQIASLATDPFDSVLCSATLLGACIPQPGVTQRLETLTVWPMWRLQFRNFGTHEGMVLNHTVDANGEDLAGIRWYELRRAGGGAWSIFQQGTYAPDKEHRWMGSIAMDQDGNIGLGYSVSSSEVFPSVRRTGRLASDPPGTMTQPEAVIVAGGGAQTHSSSRYGNYSSMDVDPSDDCTFWYTTEYYATTSTAGWRTRVASFRNPECGREEPPQVAFKHEYASKVVCGLQKDPRNMQLVRGFYGTAVNIHNPGREPAVFEKKLALTYPPREEAPGKVIPIARHKLGYDEALEVDCDDIVNEVFEGRLPDSFIKGFVVVQSTQELDVTAVYTAAGLDKESEVTSVTSIDVEHIGMRDMGADRPDQCPDLTVRDIGRPSVSCPGGAGTCVTKFDYTVANIGPGDADAFVARSVADPAQSVVVDAPFAGGLLAGQQQTVIITTPPGGNCFDPDCMISVTVDIGNQVDECNERNNTATNTTLG
jgi:hypothetical protein